MCAGWLCVCFFFSSRRRHTRCSRDWSSDVCSSDLQRDDARPRASVVALLQPVMQPVFPEARHTGDVLLRAAGRDQTFQDYLQGKWRELHRRHGGGKTFEQIWSEALQRGGIYGETPVQAVRLAPGGAPLTPAPPGVGGGPGGNGP